jgi:ankyrin repeat protein
VEDFKQYIPLHLCAKFGNHTLIRILLPNTMDKQIISKALNDIRDIDGRTPLHLACIKGKYSRFRKIKIFHVP